MTQRVKTLLTATLAVAVFSSARTDEYHEAARVAVTDLGADSEKVREAAMETLRELGPAAAWEMTAEDLESDPERRWRIRELLAEWRYTPDSEVRALHTLRRVSPWVPIAEVRDTAFDRLEHPGLVEEAVRRLRDGPGAGLAGECLLERRDLMVPGDQLIEIVVSDLGRYVPVLLNRTQLPPPDPAGSTLAGICRSYDTLYHDRFEGWLLLARIDPANEEALDRIRKGEIPVRSYRPTLVGRSSDLDQAILADLLARDPARARELFARVETFSALVEAGEMDRVLSIHPESGRGFFRGLLIHPAFSGIRPALSARLNAAGIPAGGFDLNFFSTEAGDELLESVPALRQDLCSLAPRLEFENVEARLRILSQISISRYDTSRATFLRMLAARGREADITFVWTGTKELRARHQPELCVGLARLGSAAGVGLLIPLLTEFDIDVRRDAGEALKRITGQDFGYDPLASLRDRCIAARKWKIWWKENRTSFSPDRAKIR